MTFRAIRISSSTQNHTPLPAGSPSQLLTGTSKLLALLNGLRRPPAMAARPQATLATLPKSVGRLPATSQSAPAARYRLQFAYNDGMGLVTQAFQLEPHIDSLRYHKPNRDKDLS